MGASSFKNWMELGSREQNASPLWNWVAAGSREQNGASSLMGCFIKIKIWPMRWTAQLVDGVNTIGMLLTSAKADTKVGYPGVSAKDEGRDPDYFSLAWLRTRQRFRCGGVLDG
eukprot:Gb_22651 [translate_table: standard]